MLLFCSLCACKAEGNLLLMNIIKTNESHFPLWYKQLVISHEDSIIVDFHLVMLIIEKKKKRLRGKSSLPFCLSSVLRPMERTRFIWCTASIQSTRLPRHDAAVFLSVCVSVYLQTRWGRERRIVYVWASLTDGDSLRRRAPLTGLFSESCSCHSTSGFHICCGWPWWGRRRGTSGNYRAS